MTQLVPFSKFTKTKIPGLSETKVVLNEKGVPIGFVFGREAFISFLQKIDDQFESKVKDQKAAFANFAGRLIDLIEEKLPLRSSFVKEMRHSIEKANKEGWIPLDQITKSLNV